MAITADSSQWTGEQDPKGAIIVWGEFGDSAARDAASARLKTAGALEHGDPATLTQAKLAPPDTDSEGADRRNQRQLGVGTAMAASALGAAGLVIASGGALLPAVAAAAVMGTGAGIAGEAVASSLEEPKSDSPGQPGGPSIAIRVSDEADRQRAEALLRDVGAQRVVVQRV